MIALESLSKRGCGGSRLCDVLQRVVHLVPQHARLEQVHMVVVHPQVRHRAWLRAALGALVADGEGVVGGALR